VSKHHPREGRKVIEFKTAGIFIQLPKIVAGKKELYVKENQIIEAYRDKISRYIINFCIYTIDNGVEQPYEGNFEEDYGELLILRVGYLEDEKDLLLIIISDNGNKIKGYEEEDFIRVRGKFHEYDGFVQIEFDEFPDPTVAWGN